MTTNQLKRTKARNNEGSIFKKILKDGSVVHIVEISLGKKANGKRRRTQKTFNTLAAAKQGRVQMLKAQQEGRLTEVRNDTVNTYGLWWAREVKPQHIRETTAADYEDRLRRYVFPFLGHIRMVDLKTEHIIGWMNELKRSGKSTNTINGARRVLTGMCKYAARTSVIPFNPVLATDSMRRQVSEKSQVREPWNQEEMNQVLRAVVANSKLDCFLHLMMHTGMRPGEVLGLRWQDIDFESGTLTVSSQIQMISGKATFTRLKTNRSYRTLVLTEETLESLRIHKNLICRWQTSCDDQWANLSLVFPGNDGAARSSHIDYNEWQKALKLCGIEPHRLHDARHTAATLMYSQGIGIETISRVLGHSSSAITSRLYVHSVEQPLREAAQRMNEILRETETSDFGG